MSRKCVGVWWCSSVVFVGTKEISTEGDFYGFDGMDREEIVQVRSYWKCRRNGEGKKVVNRRKVRRGVEGWAWARARATHMKVQGRSKGRLLKDNSLQSYCVRLKPEKGRPYSYFGR